MAIRTLQDISQTSARLWANEQNRSLLLIIVIAASAIMLLANGAVWLRSALTMASNMPQRPFETTTLFLNIVLLMLGWQRYRALKADMLRSRESAAEAIDLAQRDPLTGLFNRRALHERGASIIAGWRAEGRHVGALVVDIDAFKNINDLFGHAEGDAAITVVTERLQAALPGETLIARIGGDEFAVLLPLPQAGVAELETLGVDLVAALARPVILAGVDVPVSCSIGGFVDHAGDASIDLLIRNADAAMYAAKGRGRCRYCGFDGTLANNLAERENLERHLRRALAAGELFPVYEPLVNLRSGEAQGFEMLARWHSPELGVVPPLTFIPLAEEAGLIGMLTDQLLQRAMTDALQWPAHVSLSVNISPVQLRDPWFAQKLLKLMASTGFPGQRLVVEITEGALVDNMVMARAIFESLRNQGVRIALDDFGTGYSSIARLRELPFDSVKIDRDYIKHLDRNPDTASLASAVLQLSHSLGLPVVAEGVEDAEVARRLDEMDCTTAQGRLFGDSLTANEVLDYYRERDERRPTGT